jgi:hypothetical protein
MSEIAVVGKVRGTNVDQLEEQGSEEIQIHLNSQAEQIHANAAACGQENARSGRSFWVANAIGTPVAALTAIPTTAACISIYNNEPDGGRSYVIDYVWAFNVAVTAITIFHSGMIGLLGQVREGIPAAGAPVIKSSHGMGKLDTRCRPVVAALPAGTGLAALWFPLGNTWINSVVTLPGHSMIADCQGRYIVPPGRYFAVHVMSSITTNTYICGIGWTEKLLQLG